MQSDLESLKEKATVYIAYCGEKFTVATASMKIGETVFFAEGIARQSHLDEPRPTIGAEVAIGRALKALCIKLKKGTEYPIHHRFMA